MYVCAYFNFNFNYYYFLPIVHRPYRVLIYPAPKTFLEKSSIFLRYENVKKKKKRKKEKKDLYI